MRYEQNGQSKNLVTSKPLPYCVNVQNGLSKYKYLRRVWPEQYNPATVQITYLKPFYVSSWPDKYQPALVCKCTKWTINKHCIYVEPAKINIRFFYRVYVQNGLSKQLYTYILHGQSDKYFWYYHLDGKLSIKANIVQYCICKILQIKLINK